MNPTPTARLVLDHRYTESGGQDHSPFGNHGVRVGALKTRTVVGDWSSFDGPADRIYVVPTRELARPGGIRVRVKATPRDQNGRGVLVEGYLSFSLHISEDGTVGADVFRCRRWLGVRSTSDSVKSDVPVHIEFLHDDQGGMELRLDGRLVDRRVHSLGPPSGIAWPFGLSVGAWPDADLRAFHGRIERLQIERTRPPDPLPSATVFDSVPAIHEGDNGSLPF